MRVLHLLAPAPFGGLESVVRSLAAEQANADFDVHIGAIIDAGSEPHPFVAAAQELGLTIHPLSVPPHSYRLETKLVRALCEQLRPDVVHTHGYRTDVLHGPLARRMKFPWVATSHGFTGGNWKNRLYEALQRRAFRRCDAVVAVSRPMAKVLERSGVQQARLHCIPNAWSGRDHFLDRMTARQQLDIPSDVFCVGFIGRLGYEKGPDIFLEAVAKLQDSGFQAVLVGDGAMRADLESRIDASNLRERVKSAGRVENAGRLLKAFDVIVLSSRTEGTPIVLLEAMAARVPVVATRVGGIPDIVSEREALLTAKEQPAEIAAAIRSIHDHRTEAEARAARAAERLAKELDPRRWLERYTTVYRSCMSPDRT